MLKKQIDNLVHKIKEQQKNINNYKETEVKNTNNKNNKKGRKSKTIKINQPTKKWNNNNKRNSKIKKNSAIFSNFESINTLKIVNNNINNKRKSKIQRKLARFSNYESISSTKKSMFNSRKSFQRNNNISNFITRTNPFQGENEKIIIFLNDTEINGLNYKKAFEIDKRTYFQYYWSLLRKKQLLMFTFYTTNDFNSVIIKFCILLFSFALSYTINALFFDDSTMHKIYEDKGDFDIVTHMPQIIYSVIISSMIMALLKYFSLSEGNVLEMKKEKKLKHSKVVETLKCLKIKFLLFFIISILLHSFFWYYLSCFCAVYRNTQKILIKDTLISFGLSFLYPFGLNLIPGLFRIPSLKKNDRKCLYQVSKILQLVL